jgi:Uncharacterized protein conserved in bacteria (DUF2147)
LGNWLVEEKTAEVRIVDCASLLWGVFSWEKVAGIDSNNPDPALRNKPLLGSTLLVAMKPNTQQTEWKGKVYNPRDGKQYDATISLADDNTLEMKGCLIAFLCQTVQWTRVVEPAAAPTQGKVPAKAAPPKKQPAGVPKPVDFAKDPDQEICSTIPGALPAVGGNGPGPTH